MCLNIGRYFEHQYYIANSMDRSKGLHISEVVTAISQIFGYLDVFPGFHWFRVYEIFFLFLFGLETV